LPDGLSISGTVLADQVKSIDRHARRIEFAGKVPDSVVQDVQARIGPLLGLD
jgi:mRNA interferase MazF